MVGRHVALLSGRTVHFLYCGLIHMCHLPSLYFKSQHFKYSNYFSVFVFYQYVSNTPIVFCFIMKKNILLVRCCCHLAPPWTCAPHPIGSPPPPSKSIPCCSNVKQCVTLRRKFISFWLILCCLCFIVCRFFFFLISCRSWKQNWMVPMLTLQPRQ